MGRGPSLTLLGCAFSILTGCGTATSAPGASGPTSRPVPMAASHAPPVAIGAELIAEPARLVRPPQPALLPRFEERQPGGHCVGRDVSAALEVDPILAPLGPAHALPATYLPADLVPAAEAGFTGPSATKLLRSVVVEDLRALRAATEAAGLTLTIESAYRSYASQAATFESWVARLGHEAAVRRVAPPGHSEHQLGTAIDVLSPGWTGRFGDWAAETAEGAWMSANAWRYGFVMSYSTGAEADTCFGYEPWHYRWIGRSEAGLHRESGQALRTYLEDRDR